MIEIRETEIYAHWFSNLRERQAQGGISLKERQAKARIDTRIRRLSLGNLGDVKPVGQGVSELCINYEPGHRIYFIQLESTLIVLLIGGDKHTQQQDIAQAIELARNLQRESNMAKTHTRPWDATNHLERSKDLQSNEHWIELMGVKAFVAWEKMSQYKDMAAYIEAAFDDGDPALITAVLGDIARSQGMTQIARDTGLDCKNLDKALSVEGNPEFATILKVFQALGLRIQVTNVASESLI